VAPSYWGGTCIVNHIDSTAFGEAIPHPTEDARLANLLLGPAGLARLRGLVLGAALVGGQSGELL